MAHNLEIRNGQTSFVAVGEPAWHGLGKIYSDRTGLTAAEIIKDANLDYIVESQPIYLKEGIVIPGSFANVRLDTLDVLGIVSADYHVIQNTECFGFFDAIIDRGEAIYQTAGVLGKGEKIFILAKLPSDITVHGEIIETYVLLTKGHDGKTAVIAGFTSVRVVCANTLAVALQGLKNKVVISHSLNAKDRLANASKVMGMASKYSVQLNDKFNRMAAVKITDAQLKAYIETVMKPGKEQIDGKEFSKQFGRKVDSIMEFALHHDTQVTDAAKSTVWGAYNAISGYYGYIKEYGSQEEKFNDIYYKTGSSKIESAFDLALKMVN